MRKKRLIHWGTKSVSDLTSRVHAGLSRLPPYNGEPAKRSGVRYYPLPPMSEMAPVRCNEGASSHLYQVYEEYIDRYLVTGDTEGTSARTWLRSEIYADSDILEFVFPQLLPHEKRWAIEVYLIRLLWLMRQVFKPNVPAGDIASQELTVVASGWLAGITEGRILYRFNDSLRMPPSLDIGYALQVGIKGIHNQGIVKLAAALRPDAHTSRDALIALVMWKGAEPALSAIYGSGVSRRARLSRQELLARPLQTHLTELERDLRSSTFPARELESWLVGFRLIRQKDFRDYFGLPWQLDARKRVTADQLIAQFDKVETLLNLVRGE